MYCEPGLKNNDIFSRDEFEWRLPVKTQHRQRRNRNRWNLENERTTQPISKDTEAGLSEVSEEEEEGRKGQRSG